MQKTHQQSDRGDRDRKLVYFTLSGDLQPTYTGPKDPITFSNDGWGV